MTVGLWVDRGGARVFGSTSRPVVLLAAASLESNGLGL